MRARRRCAGIARGLRPAAMALLALMFPAAAASQEPAAASQEHAAASQKPAAEDGAASWEGRASASWYFLPDEPDYAIVTGAADRGPLHLEARYGYEDRRTVSAFVGWNLAFGEEVTLELVPMLGGAVGRTNGLVAPALELTLAWGPLQYYLEAEVLIDLGDTSASYLYAWSELSASPLEWLRAGLVIQRTRVIHTSREVTPGLLLGFSLWRLELTGYWFAPGAEGQYAAVSAGVRF